jgi:hypothetical protein
MGVLLRQGGKQAGKGAYPCLREADSPRSGEDASPDEISVFGKKTDGSSTLNRAGAQFVVTLLLALLLHAVPLVHFPFDWFQTFFHEFSHGLAALVTGGRIETIHIAFDASGRCLTRESTIPLILFSGYAGGALWGSLIYLSVTTRHARTIALSLSLFVLLVGVLWVRDWTTPWILATIIGMFLLAYRFGSRKWLPHFVKFIGLYTVLEAVRSPFYLLDGTSIGDGSELARLTYLPEFVWIAIWASIAISCILLLGRTYLKIVTGASRQGATPARSGVYRDK